MNRIHHSLVVAAVAASLCGGIGVVRAGWSAGAPSAVRLDEHRFPHMHNALERLSAARAELDQAEDDMHGRKGEVIGHVDQAIQEVKDGLKEHHDESTTPMAGANKLDDQNYPHLHAALDHLRESREALNNAEAEFQGHRDRAMEHVNKAIKQLEEFLH